MIASGKDCTIHLAGSLEQLLPEEEEEDDSDDMWNCSDTDSDSEIESGSQSDTATGMEGGTRNGLLAMLDSVGDSDSDDEDFG